MIITLMGPPSSGKSYLARRLAEHYAIPHFSIGDLRRKAAAEKGMTIAEFNALGETEDTDTFFDNYQKNLPKTEPDFVIDGRLSAFFLPTAIKVYVDADEATCAQRMLAEDPHHKRIGESAQDEEEALKLLRERIAVDIRRYKRHYDFDPYNKSFYDIVLDTTHLDKEAAFQELLRQVESKRKI